MEGFKHASKQASKKTDFTVDLIWWGSLRLAPTKAMPINAIDLYGSVEIAELDGTYTVIVLSSVVE